MRPFVFRLPFIGADSEFVSAPSLLVQENWTVGMVFRNVTSGRFAMQWGERPASTVLGSSPEVPIVHAFQDALTSQQTAGGVKG